MDGRTKSGHDGLRRGRLRCCDCPLTSVPVYVTSGANHLARKGRRRGGKLRRWGERRSPRAGLQPVPGRSGHHARRHYDRRARRVAGSGCGAGGHIRRVGKAPTEAWPGSHQGTTHPLGRAVVERRKASCPLPFRGRRRTPRCGGYGTASFPAFHILYCHREERRDEAIRD